MLRIPRCSANSGYNDCDIASMESWLSGDRGWMSEEIVRDDLQTFEGGERE
jgi:hypothetical protein